MPMFRRPIADRIPRGSLRGSEVYDFLVNPHQTAISPRVPFGGLRRPRPFPQTTGLGRLPSPSKSTPWVAGADSWKTWIEIIPKITIPRHNARLFSRVVSDSAGQG